MSEFHAAELLPALLEVFKRGTSRVEALGSEVDIVASGCCAMNIVFDARYSSMPACQVQA